MKAEEIIKQLEVEASDLKAHPDAFVQAAAARVQLYAAALRWLLRDTVHGTLEAEMVLTSAQLAAVKSAVELRKAGPMHPLQAWLYAKDETYIGPRTLEALADALKLKPAHVRSWCRARDPRRTPEATARVIERRWGFPATAANYPNGIKPAPHKG